MSGVCRMHGIHEKCIKYLVEYVKEKYHLGDSCVEGR
jgi:hypothetical protein